MILSVDSTLTIPACESATAQFRRRRDVEAVLNPDGLSTYAHLGRALDLAVQYQWTVRPVGTLQADAAAQWSTRTIFTPPLTGDAEFARFVHEGGHVQDENLSLRPTVKVLRHGEHYSDSLHAERIAWTFALVAAGYRWNQAMHVILRDGLASYRRQYRADAEEERAIDALIEQSKEAARGVVRLLGRDVCERMTR